MIEKSRDGKSRLLYLALAFVTMLPGLASRSNDIDLHPLIATVANPVLDLF